MAGYTNTIAILIQAKDEASAVLKATAQSVEATSGKLNAVASSMTDLGGAMTKGLTLPMAAAGLAGLKLATDFQQSMELIRTQAGASQQEVDNLSKSVLAMAPSVGQGPDKLAKALFFIESSGIRGAQALDVLKLSAEGANVGQADLADTANALTSTMNSQIKGAETATSAMGLLNAIVGAGKMHFQDLNDAISSGFLETAKLFGVSLDSVGAALATLTRVGEPAAQSATRLRMAITLMAAPTNQAAKVLSGIGISADEVKASTQQMTDALAKAHVTTNQLARDMQQPNGFNVAITDLRDHLVSAGLKSEEAAAVIARAFGGGRTSGPIMALVQNASDLNSTFAQITQTSGNFASSVAAQQQTASQQFKDSWQAVEVQLIRLGNDVMPIATRGFTDFANAVTAVAHWFDGLSPTAKTFFGDTAIALAAGGPIIWGLGKVVGFLADAKDALSKLPKQWDDFSSAAGKAFDKASSGAGAAKDGIGNLASKLSDYVGVAKDAVGKFARNAIDTASAWGKAAEDTAKSALTRSAETVSSWASAGKQMVIDSASTVASTVGHAAQHAGAWIKAAHESEQGLGGTLATMAINSLEKTGEMILHAGAVSVAWVVSAAKTSFAWVTVELPKIVKSFILTSASAVKEAALSSIAWVKEAAVSSYAWVTTELPRIVASFVLTSASAVKESIVSSASWVKESIVSGAAWVAESATVIASFVASSVAAGANALAQAAMWVASAIQAGAYAVAIDAAKTQLAIFQALAASPVLMGAIGIAGALADIALVAKAVEAVRGAISATNDAANAAAASAQGTEGAISTIIGSYKSGKISKATEIRDLQAIAGNAKGTSYWKGGRTVVGELGPEVVDLPRGSKVYPAQQSQKMAPGGDVHFNQTNHIYNNMDMTAANRELGWRLAHA